MADKQRSRFWLWYWVLTATIFALSGIGAAADAKRGIDDANQRIRDLQNQVDELTKCSAQHMQPNTHYPER